MPREIMQVSPSARESPLSGDTMSNFRRRSRLTASRSAGCADRRQMLQRSRSARSPAGLGFAAMFQGSNNNENDPNTPSDTATGSDGCPVSRMRSLMMGSGRSLSFRNLMSPQDNNNGEHEGHGSSKSILTDSTAPSSSPSSPSSEQARRRHQHPQPRGPPPRRGGLQRSKSCRSYRDLIVTPDPEDQALDDLEQLTNDLERMAQMLRKTDNAQKILAKHVMPTKPKHKHNHHHHSNKRSSSSSSSRNLLAA